MGMMLKAHSWANLNVSGNPPSAPKDTTLQFNSNTVSKLRQHKSHLKEKEDDECCTLATSDIVTNNLHMPLEQNSTWQDRQTSHMFIPIPRTRTLRNNSKSHREVNKTSSHRMGNDTVSGYDGPRSSRYNSCTDITTLPMVAELDNDEGRITSDQLYTTVKTHSDEVSTSTPDTHVFRAHSLGDLTTGLTLSLVGQRQADSMLNLSENNNMTTQNTKMSLGLLKESRLKQTREINGNIPEETTQKVTEVTRESGHLSQQTRCLPQGRVSPNVAGREVSPLKGRRCLPHVPVTEGSERIKRFTELMKARMALNSRASQGTISVSSMPVTPHQPDAQHNLASVSTPSDNEVSNFFSPDKSAGHRTPRKSTQDRAPQYLHTENKGPEAMYRQSKGRAPVNSHQHIGVGLGHSLSLNCTPKLPEDSADLGHPVLHSHPHCSTSDSGYVTNNDFDTDISNTMVSHLYNERRTSEGLKLSQKEYMSKCSDSLYSSYYDHVRNITGDPHFRDTASHGRAARREVALYTNSNNTVLKGIAQSDETFLTTVNGFRPVREDDSVQYYHHDVHDAGYLSHHTLSGKKIAHYASQPNLNLALSKSGEENFVRKKSSHQRVLHKSTPVIVKNNKVENPHRSKSSSAGRRWCDGNMDPDKGLGGVQSPTASASSSHPPSWSPGQQSDAYLQHQAQAQNSDNSLRCATLPGNWRFNGKGDNGYKIPVTKFPTLYQMAQVYNFHGTKIVLPRGLPLDKSLQLIDHVVELPSLRETLKDPVISSMPKGNYPCLGGPGSAFQPVKSKGVTPFTVVAVGGIHDNMLEAASDLKSGDIIIEMNGRLVLGADSTLVRKTLEIIQGEIILTVARSKSEINNTSVKMDQMVKEIDFLRAQIAQRDTCIRDMQSLLPWQQEVSTAAKRLKNDDIPNEEVEISDDEFIV
ncbi:uncharacterized protein LOC124288804 [Haliotis rubra]|uniref:uncharacterized protein LOC124288804 n=1 Tax=Haliotis rubra TaxID=36100 RepID=UPI001EE5A203|nr:uncharacterized protein LOC124288804 [Haliotis rubra]